MRNVALGVVWVGFLAALALVAGGFGGSLHPAGDTLAVARLQAAGVATALGIALIAVRSPGRRIAGLWVAAALLATSPSASGYFRGGVAEAAILTARLYQKNLNHRTGDLAAIAADIRARGADVVTLQEVSRRNSEILAMLASDYPAMIFCPYRGVGGTAVLSRWPLAGNEGFCTEERGFAALRLEAPVGPLWVVTLHLHWPWPHGQTAQVDRLAPVIAALDGPILVAGDFNMVPWGAARAMRIGATVTTFPRFALLPMPIDHVLLPEGWAGRLDLLAELGSDHRGLLVHFAPGR